MILPNGIIVNAATTTFLVFQLMLICWSTVTVVANPPAETSNASSKNLEDFRNHLRSTLTNYLMTQTHARQKFLALSYIITILAVKYSFSKLIIVCLPSKHRYGKRMAPALSKANWSVQNPAEEWTGPYGDEVATASGKGGNVMDICFKINTSPDIENL